MVKSSLSVPVADDEDALDDLGGKNCLNLFENCILFQFKNDNDGNFRSGFHSSERRKLCGR